MAYLAKARKDDLKTLATELGLEIGEMMRVIDFKNLILTSKDYDEQFTKTLLETIIETRVQAERDEKEEIDCKRKQEGLILELERMKLSMTATSTNTSAAAAEKINIQHLIPRFVENSDISTYLKIFERQCEQVNIHWCAKIKYEVEKLAYQLNEEAERTERPIRRLTIKITPSCCLSEKWRIINLLDDIWMLLKVESFAKLEEGRSVTSVAAEFGIAHSIVSRLWRQFQTTGTAIVQ
ncbi:hypothetical protein TNCV_1972141 [Trichonephila clavipes]|nr:hypothetical protein TNCV_1972141 [Trichonephila clavipes]